MAATPMNAIGRAVRQLRGEGLAAHLIRGSVGTAALGFASKGLSLISGIILGRSLGSAGYGYYAFAIAAVGFISIPAQLGLPPLIVREVAVGHARGEWSLLRGLRVRAGQIAAGSTLLGAILLGGGMLIFADRIAALDPLTFGIALLLLPLQVAMSIVGGFLRGLRRVVQGTWPSTLLQPMLYVLLLGFCARWMTSAGAISLNLVSTIVGSAVTIWLFCKYWPAQAREAPPEYRTCTWIASLLPFTLIAGINLFNQRSDILLLGVLTSASHVGIYNVAIQGAMLVSFPLTICDAMLAPNIARLHAQDDHPRMQRLMTTSTLVISLASAGVTAALILTGRWLLPNLFGAGFAAAYPALVILAIGQFINSSTGPLGSFLTMTGNERSALTCTWMAALLNIALNLVLIPFFQTAGAAIATSLSLTVWNVMLGIQVYKRVGILPGSIGWWNAKRRFHNAREVIE
ncbi:MAG TPA: flippase [Sphingomonadaceae bacterium]